MFNRILLAFCCCLCSVSFACEPSVSGKLNMHTIEAKVFPSQHTLRIWVPPDYDKPENAKKIYPVLYLLDGQNLFDRCTSYIGVEWNVDETIAQLISEEKMPPVIVVGIDNAGAKRAEEYLPFDDPFNPSAQDTRGKLFPKFLMQDVIPLVRSHYRIAEGAENTAIGGSSYGGVAALNFALNAPLFASKVLIESLSMQVGNGVLLRQTRDLFMVPPRIYVGIGSHERGNAARDPLIVQSVQQLAENLASAVIAPAVFFAVGEGHNHNESAWSKRLRQALIFLYGTGEANVKTSDVKLAKPG